MPANVIVPSIAADPILRRRTMLVAPGIARLRR